MGYFLKLKGINHQPFNAKHLLGSIHIKQFWDASTNFKNNLLIVNCPMHKVSYCKMGDKRRDVNL